MQRELFTPNRLFTPGPTPTPWTVKQSYLETDIYHRSKEFETVVLECADMLKPLFGCRTRPIILTCSGTGAMEAAVTYFTAPGDQVIVLSAGKFGARWEKLCKAYACAVETVTVANGKVPKSGDVTEVLKRFPSAKTIFFQAHETSTGARLPVDELVSAIQKAAPECRIVVDAISSLGAHPISLDRLGIDCLISGSQKGFGVAPGLAFVAMSDRGWDSPSARARFYFDLTKERKGQETGRTAFTPAISLMLGLHASLTEIKRIGVDAFSDHHARLGRAMRAAVQALGLELFVEDGAYSNALTAIRVPEGLDGVKVLTTAKTKYGALISGGQDELKGKIIRFSHLGFVGPFQLIEGIAALEFAFADEGWKFELGSGVTAAMKTLRQ